jgi:hypothetical protein
VERKITREEKEILKGRNVGNKILKIKILKEIKPYTKNIKTESDRGTS